MGSYKKIYEDNENDNSEETKLLNYQDIYNKNLMLYKINIFFNYLFFIVIVTLQCIFLYYFIKIGNILDNFKDINIDDIDNYINKTKTIVNYVCDNLIAC